METGSGMGRAEAGSGLGGRSESAARIGDWHFRERAFTVYFSRGARAADRACLRRVHRPVNQNVRRLGLLTMLACPMVGMMTMLMET